MLSTVMVVLKYLLTIFFSILFVGLFLGMDNVLLRIKYSYLIIIEISSYNFVKDLSTIKVD